MYKAISLFRSLATAKSYWLSLLIAATVLMLAALYFQYVREELPCLMCIQVRMWLALLIFVAIIGLLTRSKRWMNLILQLTLLGIATGLVDRSYILLGTERGFVFSDCGFELGLPSWLALDSWFPWLFRVETTCGYTPELLFGITMAEAMMVLSVLMAFICGLVFLASLLPANMIKD